MDNVRPRKFSRFLHALNADNCDVGNVGMSEEHTFEFGGRNYVIIIPVCSVARIGSMYKKRVGETNLGIPERRVWCIRELLRAAKRM